MSNALHLQIENAATLIAALTPQTDATATFGRIPGDLMIGSEPPVRHRAFDVYFDEAAPRTQRWFGTSHAVRLARFRVEVNYDARHDQPNVMQTIVEDTDQIITRLESPDARVSSDVLQVNLVERAFTDRAAGGGDFLTMTLIFECEYRVAV